MHDIKKALTISLLFLGFLLIAISSKGIEGAIIGTNNTKYSISFFLGLISIILSSVLGNHYGRMRTLEDRTLNRIDRETEKSFYEQEKILIPKIELEKMLTEDISLILFDTNFIIDYQKQIISLINRIQHSKNKPTIIIPEIVINELKGNIYKLEKTKIYEQLSGYTNKLKEMDQTKEYFLKKEIKGKSGKTEFETEKIRIYTQIATEYLKETEKSKAYFEIQKHLILGKYRSEPLSATAHKFIREIKERIGIPQAREIEDLDDQSKQKFVKILNNNYKSSPADAEILGMALYKAEQISNYGLEGKVKNHKVVIMSSDRDFKDAINLINKSIKPENANLKLLTDYIEVKSPYANNF